MSTAFKMPYFILLYIYLEALQHCSQENIDGMETCN